MELRVFMHTYNHTDQKLSYFISRLCVCGSSAVPLYRGVYISHSGDSLVATYKAGLIFPDTYSSNNIF